MADEAPSPKRPAGSRTRKPVSIPEPTESSGMVRRKLELGEKGAKQADQRLEPRKAPEPGRPKVRTTQIRVPSADDRRDRASGGEARESKIEITTRGVGIEPVTPPRGEGEARESTIEVTTRGVGTRSTPPPQRGEREEPLAPDRVVGWTEHEPSATPAAEPPERVQARNTQTIAGVDPSGHVVPRKRTGGRNEEEGEEAWTESQSFPLWWVGVGIVCLVLVGGGLVLIFNRGRGKSAKEIAPPVRTAQQPQRAAPIAEIMERWGELKPVMSEIVKRLPTADEAELAGLVRGGAEAVALRKKWRARNPQIARHLPVTQLQLHAAAIGTTPYVILTGLDANHLRALAYFVKEDGVYKLDWEASEGYSEVLPGEVDQLTDDEPRMMRVVVSLSSLYTPQFPEEEYRSLTISHQDPEVFACAFVKRGTPLEYRMYKNLRAPNKTATKGRGVIKVRRGPDGAPGNHVELVEFLHLDWITIDQ